MRATLLTAQKMADSIVREAEARRDNLLAQAETDARDRIAQIQKDVEAAEDRLRQGQRELARFIASVQKVCSQELDFLEKLPQCDGLRPGGARPGGCPGDGGAGDSPCGEARRPGGPLSRGRSLCQGGGGACGGHPPHQVRQVG